MLRPIVTGARQVRARARMMGAAASLAAELLTVAVAAVGLLGGCQEQIPVPRLYTVTPQKVHSDRPLRVRLVGSELVPRYDLDISAGVRHADAARFSGFVGSGADEVPLRDFVFVAPNTMDATLDPGLRAGVHDVVVIDPRGARATLAGGFTSLGLDTTPPTLVLVAPGPPAELAPGTPISARVSIDDDGSVRDFAWEARGPRAAVLRGSCPGLPAAAPGRVICDFAFVVPTALSPGDVFQLLLTATDDAPVANRATLARTFLLQAPPRLISVAPARGSAAGGTDVIIRGVGFRPGTRVWFGDAALEPDGGVLLDEGTVVGRTPAHAPGASVVRVFTPLGESPADGTFDFVAPPTVTVVDPARVPDHGGAPVVVRGQNFTAATQIYFGTSLASAAPLQQPRHIDGTEIRGLAPAGVGPATVFAVDPGAGWAQLSAGFAWETGP
jgi:hypothetical protein